MNSKNMNQIQKDNLDEFKNYLEPYKHRKKIKNSAEFKLNSKNDYVELMFFSDQHIGSIHCEFDKVLQARDYCLKNNIYVLCGGDLIEGSTKYSIGAGIYEQNLNSTEQYFELLEFLTPLVKKNLLLSMIRGNHEERFEKTVYLDIISILSYNLKVPYLGRGGFNYLKVGNESYTIYYEHGSSGSKYIHTKMAAARKVAENFEGLDVFAWGHVHELAAWWETKRKRDNRNKTIIQKTVLMLLTGHYLSYNNSYASSYGMKPSLLGSPIVKFYKNEHKMEYRFFNFI